MQVIALRIGKDGRIDIPTAVQQLLGVSEGDMVALQIADGEARLVTPHQAIMRAQAIAQHYPPQNGSIVDELIAERRAETERA